MARLKVRAWKEWPLSTREVRRVEVYFEVVMVSEEEVWLRGSSFFFSSFPFSHSLSFVFVFVFVFIFGRRDNKIECSLTSSNLPA